MVVQLLDDFKISGVNGTRILFKTYLKTNHEITIPKKGTRFVQVALVSSLKTNYNQITLLSTFEHRYESGLSSYVVIF